MAEKMKKVSGRSVTDLPVSNFKPLIHLEDNQVPKEIMQAKPGETITLQVKGTIRSKREEAGNHRGVTLEVQALAVANPKKPAAKKK